MNMVKGHKIVRISGIPWSVIMYQFDLHSFFVMLFELMFAINLLVGYKT